MKIPVNSGIVGSEVPGPHTAREDCTANDCSRNGQQIPPIWSAENTWKMGNVTLASTGV